MILLWLVCLVNGVSIWLISRRVETMEKLWKWFFLSIKTVKVEPESKNEQI